MLACAVHQGNGHCRDFAGDKDVYIVDAYNRDAYPHDALAEETIRAKFAFPAGTADAAYLPGVQALLDKAFVEFSPDLIIYNAGTDIMAGDPLGHCNISPDGVIERDALVFSHAFAYDVPIVMLLSGGYQPSTANVIAQSIANLHQKFGLW
eukprot:TRINITY_DN1038_c0_g1_i5.p2 TRINITY_DN1038_c0_g1~~TRINITY_DN1038_c0_g1_i5.p2  ORF type:complete len:151 (-),score=30.13 TRINITY_DN1038_c0_g1_i5:17-469(-)